MENNNFKPLVAYLTIVKNVIKTYNKYCDDKNKILYNITLKDLSMVFEKFHIRYENDPLTNTKLYDYQSYAKLFQTYGRYQAFMTTLKKVAMLNSKYLQTNSEHKPQKIEYCYDDQEIYDIIKQNIKTNNFFSQEKKDDIIKPSYRNNENDMEDYSKYLEKQYQYENILVKKIIINENQFNNILKYKLL